MNDNNTVLLLTVGLASAETKSNQNDTVWTSFPKHKMTTQYKEEHYKSMINIAIDSQDYLISVLTKRHDEKYSYHYSKHRTWLHLIGLLETWNIVS